LKRARNTRSFFRRYRRLLTLVSTHATLHSTAGEVIRPSSPK